MSANKCICAPNNVTATVSRLKIVNIILYTSSFNVKKPDAWNSCLMKGYKCPMAFYAILDNLVCSLSTHKVPTVQKNLLDRVTGGIS